MESRPVAGVPAVTQTDEHAADFQRGISLREAGQLDESKRVLEAVLIGRTSQLGPNHQETVFAMSQLGRTLRALREWERAHALHAECLAIRRRDLGSDHEWTRNTMRVLADTLDGMGRGEDARRLREEAGPDRVAELLAGLKLDSSTFPVRPKLAVRDTLGDLFSRRDQGKDQGMLAG